MPNNKKRDLIKKLGSLRKEITSLKGTLNILNSQKDAFFEKRNKITKKIIGNIQKTVLIPILRKNVRK